MRRALQHRIRTPRLLEALQGLSRTHFRRPIFTFDAPAPIGPYSQGTLAGEELFVSGQLPIDPVTNSFVDGDISIHVERAIRNVIAGLQAAEFSIDDVTKTTLFLSDIANFDKANEVYASSLYRSTAGSHHRFRRRFTSRGAGGNRSNGISSTGRTGKCRYNCVNVKLRNINMRVRWRPVSVERGEISSC